MSHHRSSLLPSCAETSLPHAEGPSSLPSLERDAAAALRALHAEFPEGLASALAALLPSPVVSLASLAETAGSELASHVDPRAYRVAFTGLAGYAGMLACAPELATLVLARVLGCAPEGMDDASLESGIGRQLLQEAFQPAINAYASLWHRCLQAQLWLTADEVDLPPEEPVYLATYGVRTPQGEGQLTLALRLTTWRDALGALSPARAATPRQDMPAAHPLLDAIGDCAVTTRALLATTHISVSDLLDLRVGDIICLDTPATTPLTILVGNRPKLTGRAHVRNGQFVITIDECLPGRNA